MPLQLWCVSSLLFYTNLRAIKITLKRPFRVLLAVITRAKVKFIVLTSSSQPMCRGTHMGRKLFKVRRRFLNGRTINIK